MTAYEKQMAKDGIFNLATEEGKKALHAYSKELEAQGYDTWIENRWGDFYSVAFYKEVE
jgi:hypothetical protein